MSTSTERNPTHVYTNPGAYTVTLRITGPGGEARFTRTNYINVTTPTFTIGSISIDPVGAGTTTGAGTYDYGDTVVLTATGNPKPAAEGYCDIVFMVDESGSMATEHAWLTTLPSTLEAALQAVGIGTGTPNQYALVGFGSTSPGHGTGQDGHKHTVGGGDWGTAAQLCTAAAGLVVAGILEDGYQVSSFSLNNYAFRPGAVKLLVLITDEARSDITGGVITKASVLAELVGALSLYAVCANLDIWDTSFQYCIGRKGTRTFFGTLVAPFYTETVLYSILPGSQESGTLVNGTTYYVTGGDGAIHNAVTYLAGTNFVAVNANWSQVNASNPSAVSVQSSLNTVTDYCTGFAEIIPAAQPDGGSEWNLNILRNGGTDAISFTAAFVDVIKDQILVALDWTFSHWIINGVAVYTNPYSFVITSSTTISVVFV